MVQGEYSSAVIQAWSSSRSLLEGERERLKGILRDAVSSFVGYREDEWWFEVRSDGEGFQQVPFEPGLEGSWEWWVEDEKGQALAHEKGELSNENDG